MQILGWVLLSARTVIDQYNMNLITKNQAYLEGGSTAFGTFAPAWMSIPWNVGYEGLGRQVYGSNVLGVRDFVRPRIRKALNIEDE